MTRPLQRLGDGNDNIDLSLLQSTLRSRTPQSPVELGHVPNAPSVNVHLPRRTSSFGVVSFVLGILAFLFCWIPFIGVLSIPLGALGLLLAILGFFVALSRRGAGIAYPIAGALMCGFALVVAVNALMGMSNALHGIRPSEARPNRAKWTPATQEVEQGDVQVRVVSASVGIIPLQGGFSSSVPESSESYLKVVLEVSNLSQNKKVDFTTWMGRDFSLAHDYASIRDEHGNVYKRIDFGLGTRAQGQFEQGSIYPAKSVADVLVFQPPVSDAEHLYLELPAGNFGGEGLLRFQIGGDMCVSLKQSTGGAPHRTSRPNVRRNLEQVSPQPVGPICESVRRGDVQVSVIFASIGTVQLIGTSAGTEVESGGIYLRILVEVANLGKHDPLDVLTWNKGGASLRDDRGKTSSTHAFSPRLSLKGGMERKSLEPGAKIVDTLVFERPPRDVERLILELDGGNCGRGAESFRFEIPAGAIRR